MEHSPNYSCAVALRDYGIWKMPRLPEFLGTPIVVGVPWRQLSPSCQSWIGWGRKPSGRRAERLSARLGMTCWLLEDGFIRSLELGRAEPPLSIVLDDLGIYYDAANPSRLEVLIAGAYSAEKTARAQSLITAWQTGRVSKYNHAREFVGDLPKHFVLAVDQTRGDASIRYGFADEGSFTRMLEAALDEHSDCSVVLKIHPDVSAGRKQGHFKRLTSGQADRVRVLGRDVHPVGLLERAEAVYCVTSQMGFEGLLWGKPVRTFGMPFYAGWGLTQDELPRPDRRKRVPLENLVHAALVDYPRYIDPETGKLCAVERVLAHLALQRRMRERFPSEIHAIGFSRWKRPIVQAFFSGSTIKNISRADEAPVHGTLAVWGRKPINGSIGKDISSVHLEDGFLRSVGLGADLIRPLSWVMDQKGVYYDSTCPSDLECLLQNTDFDAELIERASRLQESICCHGLSKYNVGSNKGWSRPDVKRVILVPGQVESDASIRFGAPTIKRNIDLLKTVRRANPEAYLVYKPHPDVLAELRPKGEDENESIDWCDEIVADVRIVPLIEAVDEVHVLTSLTGFEALLRGKRVATYGQPFYAGWGLTEDHTPILRRTRRLKLHELVAGVLILYPTYVSRVTGQFTTPERAIEELLAWRQAEASELPWWRRVVRMALRMAAVLS
ncbi:MAG: capsular polysaccharide biosynthesis protein [Deltaproteobacteria bacterium]|nr:capsular polysaccharide biosynthesis protein [Deltaproteobacteria bacterium]